jgi:Uma2 family endonuclease
MNTVQKIGHDREYYTYEDWLSWDESVRAELVDGIMYMQAAPSTRHSRLVADISRRLGNFLDGKPSGVYVGPVGVRLSATEDTVFEPDIMVVCDKSKIDGKTCNGAPDLIVEVLSPSNASYDRIIKFNKYQAAGVREYWMVEPDMKMVHVSVLDGDFCRSAYHDDAAPVPVTVLPGYEIDLKLVFAEE